MPIDPKNLAGTATLTFHDEFNNLSIWNGTSGVWSTNAWYKDTWELTSSNGFTRDGNGEQQWYINDNYAPTSAVNPWSVNNGVLTITAAPASSAIQSLINGYKYTSGEVNTYHSFSQQYGYFEIRADLPAGQGLWPAFWLLPKEGPWPPELDVMEVLGNATNKLYTSVHTQDGGGHTTISDVSIVADMSQGFHTYGVDWEKDQIVWYFDGQEVFRAATPSDMHTPMYMLANLAVGGYWPGSPDASTHFPAEMQIDYIRAYSAAPGVTPAAPSAPTPSAPTPTAPTPTAPTSSAPTPTAPAPSAPSPSSSTPAAAAPSAAISTADGATFMGQAGNDTFAAANSDDHYLRGGAGADSLTGGAGFDDINGNEGDDTASGGAGDDWVVGGKNNDRLSGGDGQDLVYGNLGADTVSGDASADTVRGGQGDDVLAGGAGNDWLSGDRGSDTITGGAGADVFHGFAQAGLDRITDFHGAEGDRIHLDAGASYVLRQVGADAVIDWGGGNEMIVAGVNASTLSSGWIVEI